jgi:hypothetical protein
MKTFECGENRRFCGRTDAYSSTKAAILAAVQRVNRLRCPARCGRQINARKSALIRYIWCMPNVADVIEKALSLSMVDRSYVVSKLIESLESEELPAEAISEYDQRVARWRAGSNPSSSSEELDAKVQAILQS